MTKNKQSFLTTEKLVIMATFGALAFVVSYLEFPLFVATPWFKLDFGNVFIMLVGFLYGPIEAIICCVSKELLCVFFKTHTAGIGEIANVAMMIAYVILPAIVYNKKKGLKSVTISLIIACLLQTVVALPINRFITYPLYMGENAVEVFNSTWHLLVCFNLIKAVSVSILTLLLYKRLSRFLKRYRK